MGGQRKESPEGQIAVALRTRSFTWNGKYWFDSSTFEVPPKTLVAESNDAAASQMDELDADIMDFLGLLELAKRHNGVRLRGLQVLQHAHVRAGPGVGGEGNAERAPGAERIACRVGGEARARSSACGWRGVRMGSVRWQGASDDCGVMRLPVGSA